MAVRIIKKASPENGITIPFSGDTFVSADGETRTRTGVAHYPLKIACLPVPPHPHLIYNTIVSIATKFTLVKWFSRGYVDREWRKARLTFEQAIVIGGI